MTSTTVSVTCPSCGMNRDFPRETFPAVPLKVTCHACRHPFRFTGHLVFAGDEQVKLQVERKTPSAMTAHHPPSAAPPVDSGDTRECHAPSDRQQPAKPQFVTVLAWIFIILAGFATLISVLQNVMISTMFSLDKVHEAMSAPPANEKVPPVFGFLFRHIRLYFAAFLAVSAVTLIAAVALLKRKNWARIVFIWLMAAGILWNVAGVVLQQVMMSSIPQVPAAAPAEFRQRFELIFSVMRVVMFLMAIGMSVLFGWIIKRLVSPAVREEFAETPS